MTKENLKIVIPMAGYGTRLRPHTWSKPKPLVSAAGKAVLGHVLDILGTIPNFEESELIFIVGYLGEQVEAYMRDEYPQLKTRFVEQVELKGQSHAIAMAREHINGPALITFVDTLLDTDLAFLGDEQAEAVIWVKAVEDPRRFGVVKVGEDGWVESLIEKPDSFDNKLAVAGIYYFSRGEILLEAIDEQINKGMLTKGEYFLADAVGLMLNDGLQMRPEKVELWLDAGVPDTVLETNRYLLDHGRDNSKVAAKRKGVTVIPPVYIHPSAEITESHIGPHVSVGPGCRIEKSEIVDSVLERDVEIKGAKLQGSLIGERARVIGVAGIINIGDDSSIEKA